MKKMRPGRATPTAERSLCPDWCEDQDRMDHWDNPGKVWQTIHARRFGPYPVYLPQEIHDDGAYWIGRCEIHLDESEEVVAYADEAAVLAGHLKSAAEFATSQNEITVARARAGEIWTSEALVPGRDLPFDESVSDPPDLHPIPEASSFA